MHEPDAPADQSNIEEREDQEEAEPADIGGRGSAAGDDSQIGLAEPHNLAEHSGGQQDAGEIDRQADQPPQRKPVGIALAYEQGSLGEHQHEQDRDPGGSRLTGESGANGLWQCQEVAEGTSERGEQSAE